MRLSYRYPKQLIFLGRIDKLNNQHEVTRKQYELLRGVATNPEIQVVVTDGSLMTQL